MDIYIYISRSAVIFSGTLARILGPSLGGSLLPLHLQAAQGRYNSREIGSRIALPLFWPLLRKVQFLNGFPSKILPGYRAIGDHPDISI